MQSCAKVSDSLTCLVVQDQGSSAFHVLFLITTALPKDIQQIYLPMKFLYRKTTQYQTPYNLLAAQFLFCAILTLLFLVSHLILHDLSSFTFVS